VSLSEYILAKPLLLGDNLYTQLSKWHLLLKLEVSLTGCLSNYLIMDQGDSSLRSE